MVQVEGLPLTPGQWLIILAVIDLIRPQYEIFMSRVVSIKSRDSKDSKSKELTICFTKICDHISTVRAIVTHCSHPAGLQFMIDYPAMVINL